MAGEIPASDGVLAAIERAQERLKSAGGLFFDEMTRSAFFDEITCSPALYYWVSENLRTLFGHTLATFDPVFLIEVRPNVRCPYQLLLFCRRDGSSRRIVRAFVLADGKWAEVEAWRNQEAPF